MPDLWRWGIHEYRTNPFWHQRVTLQDVGRFVADLDQAANDWFREQVNYGVQVLQNADARMWTTVAFNVGTAIVVGGLATMSAPLAVPAALAAMVANTAFNSWLYGQSLTWADLGANLAAEGLESLGGAIGTAYGGPLGGLIGTAIGAGLGQMASNALTGRRLDEGLLFSMGFSALTEGAGMAVGATLGRNSRLRQALGLDDVGHPGRVVDIDEAVEKSHIPREYLERAQRIAVDEGVDAAFRRSNRQLLDDYVQRMTVPKPADISGPPYGLWSTNRFGYAENQWTGKVVVQRSSGRLIELPPSKVYDPVTGKIHPRYQGRVVGPDIDPYWWHGKEGRIMQGTDLDSRLQRIFSDEMGGRITHGQHMEFSEATGPRGPALVIHQGKFIWLEESEILAWFDYVGVPYPFSR